LFFQIIGFTLCKPGEEFEHKENNAFCLSSLMGFFQHRKKTTQNRRTSVLQQRLLLYCN